MMNKADKKRRASAFLLAFAALLGCGALCASIAVRAFFPLRYKELVDENCERFEVEKSLVYAVIHTESGFDPDARSSAGALGLMQIMPETFGWLQGKLEPEEALPDEALFEPEVNIRYGVYLLSILTRYYSSSKTLTIAAYHAGMGSVDRWINSEQLPREGCTAGDIPSNTTGHYVRKVERAEYVYKRLYDC